jgi:hypothetical protein
MFNDAVHNVPNGFADIRCESEAMGFSMPSDLCLVRLAWSTGILIAVKNQRT